MNQPSLNMNNVASIASSAVLISLSIGSWSGRMLDRRASEDVTTQANAEADVAKVSKQLLGKCDSLKAIHKFAANARSAHYAMTVPWSDSGLRLCASMKYPDYVTTMSALQQEFGKLCPEFYDEYDWLVQQAQLKLGTLFCADDYPARQQITNKFYFNFTAIPVPEVGDWRVDMSNQTAKDVWDEARNQYAQFYNEQIAVAMNDVWGEVRQAVEHMSERLDYTDDSTKKKFHNTLVSNMMGVVDKMSAYNLSNDPTMEDARIKLSNALRGITAESLRQEPHLRVETKRRVDEVKRIIDNLPGLGF
jgi:gamma-glutamylcyclotransferase (GGCT)/AIG2-like uncharacterized protein YtfP